MESYVELNRGFEELRAEEPEDVITRRSYALALNNTWGYLSWDDLLKHRLVIILGEPGSGKSKELMAQSERHHNSFLLGLDRLVREPVSEILSSDDMQRLRSWKNSEGEALFLLDAVDESKLIQDEDFSTAIRRVSNEIGPALARARFVITSRVSEWRSQTDLDIVTRNLLVESPKRTGDSGDDDMAETGQIRTEEAESSESAVIVAMLRPLTSIQVRTYVEAGGARDAAEFLENLQNSNTVAFAGRPIDVAHLYEYWQQHHHLGSLTGVVDFVIAKLLTEVSGKKNLDKLSPADAREGAEYLAAAAILCKNLKFGIPDDGRFAESAHLPPPAILPANWQPAQRNALMNRSLFDSPSRGALSFHHRSHIEYLAARWLERMMANNCYFDDLQDVLFAEVDGKLTLKQPLAPVAAWMITDGAEGWRTRLATLVFKTAPEIHLQFGDPAALSLAYRRRVLAALVEKYGNRQYVGIRVSPDALARIADARIAGDINGYLADENVSDELKIDLLMVIWEGNLLGCIETALDLFSRPVTSKSLRSYCVHAIQLVGTPEHKIDLARRARDASDLTEKEIGYTFEALYPTSITVDDSLDLLRQATAVPKYNHDLQKLLARHLADVLRPNDATTFLRGFMAMAQELPLTERRAVSQRFHWVMPLVPACLLYVLQRITDCAADLATILDAIVLIDGWLINGAYADTGGDDYVEKVRNRLKSELAVRRALLWRRFAALENPVPIENFPFSKLGPSGGLVKLDVQDIEWLLEDIEQKDDTAERVVALMLLLRVLNDNRISKVSFSWRLRRVLSVAELRIVFAKHLWGDFNLRLLWKWRVRYQHTYSQRWWWQAKHRSLIDKYRRMRNRLWLHTHLLSLSAGDHPFVLSQLTSAMIDAGGNRFSIANWEVVESKFGKKVSSAAEQGCASIWHRFEPRFPHETSDRFSTDRRAVVGLIGLQTLWKKRKLDFTAFKTRDVERAIRYACNELNGFPEWFSTLAVERSAEVEQALSAPIAAEYLYPEELERVHDVVSKLGAAPILTPAADAALLTALNVADPRNSNVLEQTFSALRRGSDGVVASLKSLAPSRVAAYRVKERSWVIWMATWMEVDAIPAMTYLAATLDGESANDADEAMVSVCSRLRGQSHLSEESVRSSHLTPAALAILIPLVYEHVRPENDIDRSRGGAYSPTQRDNAQDFRDRLWETLRSDESRDAEDVLRSFLDDSRLSGQRDWILSILEARQGKLADPEAWQPEDIRTFAEQSCHQPRSDYQLFRLASRILKNFKSEVEMSESVTNRRLLRDDDREEHFQGILESRLRERSLNWFSVTKESEIDEGQRPDLRVERPGLNALPIEVKLASLPHWTLSGLLEGLESQLVGQYLRAAGVNHGIYVVATTSPTRRWRSVDGHHIYFEELIRTLQARATELVASRPNKVYGLEVIGIDFSDPRERRRMSAAVGRVDGSGINGL